MDQRIASAGQFVVTPARRVGKGPAMGPRAVAQLVRRHDHPRHRWAIGGAALVLSGATVGCSGPHRGVSSRLYVSPTGAGLSCTRTRPCGSLDVALGEAQD